MSENFDNDIVSHLANLAQIDLTNDEKFKFSTQLNSIVDKVKKISKLDLKNVETLTNPIHLENVYRKDEIKPSISREKALKNAPQTQDNQFKVAKVL
jgi:aspartyl-tRNA(Asn)/glutamyl-tRNA(Gln) amidotransferase subunit C